MNNTQVQGSRLLPNDAEKQVDLVQKIAIDRPCFAHR